MSDDWLQVDLGPRPPVSSAPLSLLHVQGHQFVEYNLFSVFVQVGWSQDSLDRIKS